MKINVATAQVGLDTLSNSNAHPESLRLEPALAAAPDTHDHRDMGNPMVKVYDIGDWRSWARRTDRDY